MYNRATAELAEQVKAWEARERGSALSRSEMLQRQARRARSEAAKTEAFHGRVETWLTGKAADVEAGVRPPSPSYQTKNLAAHHRFRDRDPSKELGPMRCDPRHVPHPACQLTARRGCIAHAPPHCAYMYHRMSAKHYTIPGGLYGTHGSYLATARIDFNHTKTLENLALCQEAYKQPNELPSHAKYSMRERQKKKELHAPLRFGDASEAERIHNATLRDQMLETHGQYDHSLHASKFPGPHSPRQASNTAPRYREYAPTKWMGKPLSLTSTGAINSHTQRIGDNHTMPHDYVDMNLPHTGSTAWAAYNGRIGSLARQRRPAKEVDQDR